jgi:hypothetical protein
MASESAAGKQCSRGCGTIVYFDKNSPTGHPSPDKWIPLEIKEGRKTDVAHNCSRRNNGSTLDVATTTAGTIPTIPAGTTTTAAVIAKPDSLEFAETLIEILQYVRLKLKEQAVTKYRLD